MREQGRDGSTWILLREAVLELHSPPYSVLTFDIIYTLAGRGCAIKGGKECDSWVGVDIVIFCRVIVGNM